MKYLVLFCLSFIFTTAAWAQSCCSLKASANTAATSTGAALAGTAPKESATAQFAGLANDSEFRASHDAPKAYVHQTRVGKQITYPTPDGKTANAFVYMANKPTEKYLLVFHEWWGLNDYVKREAERLYKDMEDVNVIALDLYDGRVATTQEQAQQFMQSVNDARARAIINGAFELAKKGTKEPEIGTIGWCFGGGWSLQAAIMAGDMADACVMYYGMPEQDVQKLNKLHCPVLGIFAKQDAWITPEVVDIFEDNMDKADEKLLIKMYDANHAFANPSNPHYDLQATTDAYKAALEFLDSHID